MTEHLFDRFLGPYPRMYVTGSSVTQQQAMEIIRRTDQLFESLSTNDYAYLQRIARKLRLPLLEDFERDNLDEQAYRAARERWYEAHQHWLERWGYISTEYVINDWISSRSARGPRGWCHPDGTIGFLDPVGKGQIAEEVYRDWCLLARAFPFLQLGVTLLREPYEGQPEEPQVGFVIDQGRVQVVDPLLVDVHAGHPPASRGGPLSKFHTDLGNLGDDQTAQDRLAFFQTLLQAVGATPPIRSIPWAWIEEWALHLPQERL